MLQLEKQCDHDISKSYNGDIYPKDPTPRSYMIDDQHTRNMTTRNILSS
jgi:hypothetical protein